MVRGRIAHPQGVRGLVAGPCSWGPNPRHIPLGMFVASRRRGAAPGRFLPPLRARST
eukprot:gene21447-biopygen14694